ncbi:MAG TPA: endonuclease/exonuclease/phosphatase family protein [Saprospiraceae bacterium]|nr:endonuclease/exonuclease/phosphatase family protein [Saprospiraceae bacterium]
MTRAKSNPKAGRLKKWMLLINFSFIILLLLTYATPYMSVKTWGWLSLLALAYPFILLANGIFATGWILVRSWFAVFSIIAILAGAGIHSRYIQILPSPGKKSLCKESIRILTYNMRGLSMIYVRQDAGIQAKIDSLYNVLTDLKEYPDIICLQEAIKGDLIGKRFGLNYSVHAPKSSLWLLSRYQILKNGQIEGAEESPSTMWADIKTPQGIVRVYNMHLVSNRVTNTTEELIQDMDLKNENTWNNIRFIVSRYKSTTQKRAKEASAIRAHMASCKYPVILAGDGNDTPLSHTYNVLKKGLKDSFEERGLGLSTTYESRLPLLRIDYVLGSPGISFKDHYTHHIRYSDHFPVSAGICIQSKTGS